MAETSDHSNPANNLGVAIENALAMIRGAAESAVQDADRTSIFEGQEPSTAAQCLAKADIMDKMANALSQAIFRQSASLRRHVNCRSTFYKLPVELAKQILCLAVEVNHRYYPVETPDLSSVYNIGRVSWYWWECVKSCPSLWIFLDVGFPEAPKILERSGNQLLDVYWTKRESNRTKYDSIREVILPQVANSRSRWRTFRCESWLEREWLPFFEEPLPCLEVVEIRHSGDWSLKIPTMLGGPCLDSLELHNAHLPQNATGLRTLTTLFLSSNKIHMERIEFLESLKECCTLESLTLEEFRIKYTADPALRFENLEKVTLPRLETLEIGHPNSVCLCLMFKLLLAPRLRKLSVLWDQSMDEDIPQGHDGFMDDAPLEAVVRTTHSHSPLVVLLNRPRQAPVVSICVEDNDRFKISGCPGVEVTLAGMDWWETIAMHALQFTAFGGRPLEFGIVNSIESDIIGAPTESHTFPLIPDTTHLKIEMMEVERIQSVLESLSESMVMPGEIHLVWPFPHLEYIDIEIVDGDDGDEEQLIEAIASMLRARKHAEDEEDLQGPLPDPGLRVTWRDKVFDVDTEAFVEDVEEDD